MESIEIKKVNRVDLLFNGEQASMFFITFDEMNGSGLTRSASLLFNTLGQGIRARVLDNDIVFIFEENVDVREIKEGDVFIVVGNKVCCESGDCPIYAAFLR